MTASTLPEETLQAHPEFDSRTFRNALGCFATGVAVVTAQREENSPIGLTINSFSSVSLNPPLVLWSLDVNSPNLENFQRATHYAINILSLEQEPLSNHFATSKQDKFSSIEWAPGLGKAPLLPNCHAHFEVRNEYHYPGGDHLIFIGHVERFSIHPDVPPLLFYKGCYRHLAP